GPIGLVVSMAMRPSQGGRPVRAVERRDQGNASTTISARAASGANAAEAPGPSCWMTSTRVAGPRLLLSTTSQPMRNACLANACAMAPAPTMPILIEARSIERRREGGQRGVPSDSPPSRYLRQAEKVTTYFLGIPLDGRAAGSADRICGDLRDLRLI